MLFIQLATRWKSLIENWSKTEEIFLNNPYKGTGMKLSTKIRATAAIFFCLSICTSDFHLRKSSFETIVLNLFVAEHTISVLQTVWNFTLKMEKCNWEIEDKWKHYFTSEYNYIFELLPYNLPLAILLLVRNYISFIIFETGKIWKFIFQWINLIYIISWSFGDVFIMLISIGMARRFQQINNRLRDICRKV